MALLLNTQFETPQGITLDSTYWRWVNLGLDVAGMRAQVVLYSYASAEAFATGKQPISQRNYTVEPEAFVPMVQTAPVGTTMSDVLSNVVYDYIKATDPFFAEAEYV